MLSVLQAVVELLSDAVPNVRLVALGLLPALKQTIRLPEDVQHLVGGVLVCCAVDDTAAEVRLVTAHWLQAAASSVRAAPVTDTRGGAAAAAACAVGRCRSKSTAR